MRGLYRVHGERTACRKRFVKATERRTKCDWAAFMKDIAGHYKKAEKITLVMDNLNTHKPGSLYETFPPERPNVSGTALNSCTLQSTEAGSIWPRSN